MNFDWETPQEFFDILNKEFNFTLDVCASADNKKCLRYYSKEDNGLDFDWAKDICWMNPPYDRSLPDWIKKAYLTAQSGGTVVALIQGRSSDTRWWHEYIMKADEIRFIKDRIHFGLNKKFTRANLSSIVVVFGSYCSGPPKTSSMDNGFKKAQHRPALE